MLDHGVIFLNVTIQDGTEAVKAKVAKRLKLLPVPVQNTAARTASELTTPKMLAKQVSLELLRKVPACLKKKGITVDMEEIFREGPYILFQLRVLHVDTVMLAEDLMGHSSLVRWLVGHVSEGLQRTLEEDYLPKQILGILEQEMPKSLTKQMKDKKLAVDVKVITCCEEQALYFTSKVGEIREHECIPRRSVTQHLRRMSTSLSTASCKSLKIDAGDVSHIVTEQ